jgi:hypothetical protein
MKQYKYNIICNGANIHSNKKSNLYKIISDMTGEEISEVKKNLKEIL